jgi:hypothetical protein
MEEIGLRLRDAPITSGVGMYLIGLKFLVEQPFTEYFFERNP